MPPADFPTCFCWPRRRHALAHALYLKSAISTASPAMTTAVSAATGESEDEDDWNGMAGQAATLIGGHILPRHA